MCARRPTSAMPKPFLCCERAFCWSMVVMWPVLMHVMSFDVVVMSFDAMWLLVLCHVTWCNAMWCALMWFDAMWLLVLCHVTWCNAMSCDVRSRDELSSVAPCNGMECYELKMPLVMRSRCVFEVVLWRCGDPKYFSVLQSITLYYKVLLQYYSVLQSTPPVLLCTTKHYSSTTLCYNVLLQYYTVLLCTTKYYSVLQRTTPVLLCTAKYYSSTTLYYKVLLQYYSVLHRTTPVLLCTTKHSSSTTLHYKALLQYYSVLQRTTPVLHSTTLYYKVLLRTTEYYSSTTLYYKVALMIDPWHIWTRYLHGAELQESFSNFTNKYCACHAKWISWLIRGTYETSFTMRGATGITIQLHQILRLPRKLNLMINPRHIWKVIYNARGNTTHPPTSPNTAPATQSHSHDSSSSHMKRRVQCAEQQEESPSNFPQYCACHEILSSRCQRKIRELLPPI